MDVKEIPIPALAVIRVGKEDKSAIFETKIIQTTDNKYIYTMPVRVDRKLVNFNVKGLIKEIRVQFAQNEYYVWKNISIIPFIEDGKRYLRIKTTTPGIRIQEFVAKRYKGADKIIQNLGLSQPELAEQGGQESE